MKGIQVTNLSKRYGSTQALDGVSMVFEENRIYGLLGRNGAGKSTLLNIIANRIFADSGTVMADGRNVTENDEALRDIYLMSEKSLYPESMKVRDAFGWSKVFYPAFDEKRAVDIAVQFDLDTRKTVKSLSTGYQTAFKLATALSVNTPYLFLDEPVLGLDANNRELFYRLLIEKYSQSPFTAVISTHLIEEASGVIDGIVILKEGKIIHEGTRDELLAGSHGVSGPAAAVDLYTAGRDVIATEILGGLKTAYLRGGVSEHLPEGLESVKLDLQKLFIRLTNA
jgi:ABC-2 type transport system ATP-binding protein